MTQLDVNPIEVSIPAARQSLARHYGVHPYFTRRPANVVSSYIAHYSRPGETVLDPFGGTGVTAIEAFLLGREAIQNDINPFANFIARNIVDTSLESVSPLKAAFLRIEGKCAAELLSLENATSGVIEQQLRKVPLPSNILLPKSSDAERFHDLFTPRQLLGMAILKQNIDQETEASVRNPLLLAWSASLAKLNKTFLSAKGRAESRGGSSIFSIYRYKLAKQIIELPIWETFQARYINVLRAKEEVLRARDLFNETHNNHWILDSAKHFRDFSFDAAKLTESLGASSVDYIFTDPPYGGHITYLDLSVLWNHWLGFQITEEQHKSEAIVGGEQKLSDEHYKKKLTESIKACAQILKPGRWLSVVFQHWDLSYFAALLNAASSEGLNLRAAVIQDGNVIWSMHKKKNSENVLSGELILTFKKEPNGRHREFARPLNGHGASFDAIMGNVIKRLPSSVYEVSGEMLFNQFVVEAWRTGSLESMKVPREQFLEFLRQLGWVYIPERFIWQKESSSPSQVALF